jgi:hypothetical protein
MGMKQARMTAAGNLEREQWFSRIARAIRRLVGTPAVLRLPVLSGGTPERE